MTHISRRQFLSRAAVSAAAIGLPAASSAIAEPPRLPVKIFLRAGLSADRLAHVKAISGVSVTETLADADIVFGGFGDGDLKAAPKAKWVQTVATGVEHLPLAAMEIRNITLTNAKGCYAPEIAEHVFGLLFALTRGVAAQVRQGKWKQDIKPVELRGKTMGIIGYGGIGRETARRAKAMDLRVIAVDVEPMYRERYHPADEIALVDDGLEAMLAQSDIVVSAAPHTKKSEGMLGPAQFAGMKPGAYFVNVSRGKVVQTDALVAALQSQKLAGAGLDVTDPEPLPDDHALWKMPNVVITPHIAGQSQLVYDRVQDVFVENVGHWARGLPLLNLVDKAKGY